MQWFHEEEHQQKIDSLDFQLPQVSTISDENFAEDLSSLDTSEGVNEVLELCHEQNKDKMQLCFITENDRLMEMYDEAVEQHLVQESDFEQLREIEALCCDENDIEKDFELFPNLDGILTVQKLEIQKDDFEISQIEMTDEEKIAGNIIDDVIIKSFDDMEMQ